MKVPFLSKVDILLLLSQNYDLCVICGAVLYYRKAIHTFKIDCCENLGYCYTSLGLGLFDHQSESIISGGIIN